MTLRSVIEYGLPLPFIQQEGRLLEKDVCRPIVMYWDYTKVHGHVVAMQPFAKLLPSLV